MNLNENTWKRMEKNMTINYVTRLDSTYEIGDEINSNKMNGLQREGFDI